MKSDILGTQPGVDRDGITDTLLHHIMEGLVSYDADVNVQPLLAESWEISEDGTTYTFTLRDDVMFHNGEPMTSAEVVWSWDRWLDLETGWACTDWYDGTEDLEILSVTAPDESTVVFELNVANSLFLAQIANIQCLTAIVHPDSVDAEGNWVEPIGTGPYMLSEWNQGVSVTIERFDDYTPASGPASAYAGERIAYLDAVEFIVVPETATALAGLQSGDLDLVDQIQPNDRNELNPDLVTIHEAPSLEWNVLLMRVDNELMSDINMRRAVALAIDFAVLAQTASSGIVGYNPSTIPEGSVYHTAVQAEGYERDLEEVARLLEAAGYDGTPLQIQTNRRFNNMYQNAVIIQAMLAEAGINSELDVLEWAAHLDNYFNGQFQLSAFGYSARTDPALNYRSVLGEDHPAFQWYNTDAIAMVNEAAVIGDPERRQALFDEVHRMMIEEVPTLNLYNAFTIDVTSNRLQGYQVWPAAKPYLWNVWIEE
ncbi:MAG: ABC transporter substrate-binding protein [Hyphomonas sp.]|nr:ABC transporter substrate-binding protein [Hyphomonas sp.]